MSLDWHEWRKNGIGASDAPVLMKVSPFKTINQLWKEKLLGVSQADNPAMKRGRELEDPALNFFIAETGYLMETQVCKEHPEKNWMRATLDGWEPSQKILLEIKSCRKLHEEVPKHYYPQCQHQMEVAGVDEMYYLSYDGHEGKILKLKKNQGYIDEMMVIEEDFWNRLQEGLMDMSSDEDWIAHAEGLRHARELLKEGKELESFHLSQMLLFSDGTPAKGGGAVLFQATRKGSIDYKAIPELDGKDLEAYRKPDSSYWKVEFKKPEE